MVLQVHSRCVCVTCAARESPCADQGAQTERTVLGLGDLFVASNDAVINRAPVRQFVIHYRAVTQISSNYTLLLSDVIEAIFDWGVRCRPVGRDRDTIND